MCELEDDCLLVGDAGVVEVELLVGVAANASSPLSGPRRAARPVRAASASLDEHAATVRDVACALREAFAFEPEVQAPLDARWRPFSADSVVADGLRSSLPGTGGSGIAPLEAVLVPRGQARDGVRSIHK